MWRAALRLVYLLSWALMIGLVGIVAGSIASKDVRSAWPSVPDDWWSFMFPVGAVMGLWFGFRSAGWQLFHRACAVVTGGAAVVLFMISSGFSAKAEWRTAHPSGPLSGLGEVVMSMVTFAFAIAAVAVCIGCVAMIVRERCATEPKCLAET